MRVSETAYEDEKGRLHVKTGPISNLRQLAEQLWPINSKMAVYFNPDNPKICYVDRPLKGNVASVIFVMAGGMVVILSVIVFFLIQV